MDNLNFNSDFNFIQFYYLMSNTADLMADLFDPYSLKHQFKFPSSDSSYSFRD